MSEIKCEVLRLGTVKPHPNADRLEIAEVMGTQCIVPKGVYKTGSPAVWIPPGMLISAEAAATEAEPLDSQIKTLKACGYLHGPFGGSGKRFPTTGTPCRRNAKSPT